MHRIRDLNRYQKGLLLILLAMILIFSVLYPRTISRVGYLYHDSILVPVQEDENTVYSGKIKGEQAEFTVSGHNTVSFRYGPKNYGPYILKEDPAAVPKDAALADHMAGIEISNGDNIVFRGGILDLDHSYQLYNEDGSLDNIRISYTTSSGTEVVKDRHGNVIDRMEPSAATIYELLNGPQLTHKGQAFYWFLAVCLCILNAVSMIFADDLFRLHLALRIRNAENAEPSDTVIAGRYIGWTMVTILAMVQFIMGLQA